MKVLLDHNVSKPFRELLVGHLALTARQMRWDALPDPEMVRRAELEGFDVLLTADKETSSRVSSEGPIAALVSLLVNGITFQALESGLDLILSGIARATIGGAETILLPLRPKARKHGPAV